MFGIEGLLLAGIFWAPRASLDAARSPRCENCRHIGFYFIMEHPQWKTGV
jgi:hypothetical protein